jgi:isocitrate lyase
MFSTPKVGAMEGRALVPVKQIMSSFAAIRA